MAFDFESFCKSCHGLTSGKIKSEIQARLIELEGRAKAARKKAPFPDKNLERQYQSDIKKLETMAAFVAGEATDGTNLTENEQNLFREVVDNIKQT
jgi:hypothetical protein